MTNGNPFNITRVDVPGVFAKVQQSKLNALNFDIAQENLNAFRQQRESQAQIQEARLNVIRSEGEQRKRAAEELFVVDPDMGVKFIEGLGKLTEQEFKLQDRQNEDIGNFAFTVANDDSIPEGAPIPETLRQQAIDLGVSPEDVPTIKNKQQLLGLVAQSDKVIAFTNQLKEGNSAFVKVDENGNQILKTAKLGSNEADELRGQGFFVVPNSTIEFKGAELSPTGLTERQEGTEIIRLREAEEATANLLKTTGRLRTQLDEGGVTTGLVGTLARSVDTIVSQFVQAGQLFEGDFSPDVVKRFEDEGKFGRFAAKSQGFKTNLVRLTGALAVMINGGARPSDFDARLAQQLSAMTSGSDAQMLAAFDEIDRFSLDTTETIFQSQQRRLPADQRQEFNEEQFRTDFGIDPREADPGQVNFNTLVTTGTLADINTFISTSDLSQLTDTQLDALEKRIADLGG